MTDQNAPAAAENDAQEREALKELEKNCQLRITVEKYDDYVVVSMTNVFSFDSAKFFSKK